jgi:uncharacterized protein (TIGR00251 family)
VDAGRLVLELHVQPGASRTEVVGLHGARLKLRLAARAVDGRANAALIEFIAERLGAARRDVEIESGLSGRAKRVSVRGAKRGPEALYGGQDAGRT